MHLTFSDNKRIILRNIIFTIAAVITVFILLQIPSSAKIYVFYRRSILLKCIIDIVLLCAVWHWQKYYLTVMIFFLTVFISPVYIKSICGMILNVEEIFSCMSFGIVIFCALSAIYYLKNYLSLRPVKILLMLFTYFGSIAAMLPAALLWGYYIINRHLLQPTTVLALFQTNTNEAVEYLKGQNIFLWCFAFIMCVILIYMYVRIWNKVPIIKSSSPKIVISVVLIYVLFTIFALLPKTNNFYSLKIIADVHNALQDYVEYGEKKQARLTHLQLLTGLHINSTKSGLYVLVIGESESRDYMSIYGYHRNNTPWLSNTADSAGNIIFHHAYSNYPQTVMALTYALSEKNQYNNISLSNAYSIVEIAKAAGYNTYWLSNQRKYGAWDTPIAEMASATEHQVWINGNVGALNCETEYYDEALLDQIPVLTDKQNTLIVIHLMGSHQTYAERYPQEYNIFQNDSEFDQYDNSVLYNDKILQKIYARVSISPNFMGMIYFSDHGEDVTNGGHDPSRFTYKMIRVPLIMNFSQNFLQKNPQTYATLQAHQNSYWTNDLLYNLLIDIMGIEGAPHVENNLDITSPSYNLTKDTALTMHGEKKISNDPNVDK